MNRKREAQVLEIVKEYVDSLAKTNTGQPLPVGYNPLEKIRGALFHWVAVPFNGTDVWCQLRCPNATQLEQCGDMTNIVLKKDGDGNVKYDYDEIIRIRNYQEEICKLVFNIPTFDHIADLAGNNDFVMSEKKAELERITKYFEENNGRMTEVEKNTLEAQIKTIELQLGFILPDDTMAFVTKWAMGNDISDIKKITRDNLLRAASLARAHNKAPSDYLSGVFTDFNKNEIDTYAFAVLEEHIKDQQIVNESKHRWFLGGRKNTGGA